MAPTAVNPPTIGIELDDEMRAYVRSISQHLARGDRHLAEDIEQETFIIALQHRPRDPKAARAWLWSVARSCLSSVTGRQSRRPRTVPYADEGYAQVGHDPAETYAHDELRGTLDRALADLPEDYANVISLRILDGLPPREIAVELGIPVNTVRTRTRRGFERLRTNIDDSLAEGPYFDRRPLLSIGPFLARRWRIAAGALVAVPVLVLGFKALNSGEEDLGDTALGRAPSLSVPAEDLQFATVSDTGRGAVAPTPTAEPTQTPDVATADPVVTAPPIEILVLGVDGNPAAGAELFEHTGLNGQVQRVGVTNSRGEAKVRVAGSNAYIAARGAPGEVSRSWLMDQPSVAANAALELRLEEHPVAWIDVDTSAIAASQQDVRIEGIPTDLRILCQLGIEGGISGSSCWVPSWDGPSASEGVLWGDAKKTLAVYVDGRPAASVGPFRLFDSPPAIITVERPWTLRGKLVSAEGHAITNKLIRFTTPVPSGQHSRQIRTDAEGRFEITGLTSSSVQVEAYDLHSAPFDRPEGPVLEAGSVVLDEMVPRLTVHGTVHGAPPRFAIHPITRFSRSTPSAMALTSSSGRKPMIIDDADGAFALLESTDKVFGFVIFAAAGGEPIPAMLVNRPALGWPEEGIEVTLDRSAGATARATVAEAYLPGRVHMRHVESGFCMTSDVVDASFQSPKLFEGTWAFKIQGPDGQLLPCATAKLEPATEVDLGELSPRAGEVLFSWPAQALEGAPADWIYLTLTSGRDLIWWRAVARRDLEHLLAAVPLPAGQYRLMAQARGEAYQADFDVRAGERIGCDLK